MIFSHIMVYYVQLKTLKKACQDSPQCAEVDGVTLSTTEGQSFETKSEIPYANVNHFAMQKTPVRCLIVDENFIPEYK